MPLLSPKIELQFVLSLSIPLVPSGPHPLSWRVGGFLTGLPTSFLSLSPEELKYKQDHLPPLNALQSFPIALRIKSHLLPLASSHRRSSPVFPHSGSPGSSVAGQPASFQFSEHSKRFPTSGSLHMLSPRPGPVPTAVPPLASSFCSSEQKHHLFGEAFPDHSVQRYFGPAPLACTTACFLVFLTSLIATGDSFIDTFVLNF